MVATQHTHNSSMGWRARTTANAEMVCTRKPLNHKWLRRWRHVDAAHRRVELGEVGVQLISHVHGKISCVPVHGGAVRLVTTSCTALDLAALASWRTVYGCGGGGAGCCVRHAQQA